MAFVVAEGTTPARPSYWGLAFTHRLCNARMQQRFPHLLIQPFSAFSFFHDAIHGNTLLQSPSRIHKGKFIVSKTFIRHRIASASGV